MNRLFAIALATFLCFATADEDFKYPEEVELGPILKSK